MESLLLQWSENRGWLCSGCAEMESAKGKCPSAITIGEQAEVADLDEARGQDVKQEAADELVRLERHDLLALRADAAIVLVSEAHARFVD